MHGRAGRKSAGWLPYRLTDLLTRLCETAETERETDDVHLGHPLVNGTRRNARDEEDARRSAHNPATTSYLGSRARLSYLAKSA